MAKNKKPSQEDLDQAREDVRAEVEGHTAPPRPEPVEEQPASPQKPLVILNEMDNYIAERMKGQPSTLAEVQVKADKEHEKVKHALSLPTELEQYGKEWAFRWVNKNKRALDRALDVIGWTIVNRALFRGLPDHLFTANGSIERGDAILTCIPLKKAQEIRLKPAEISRERVRKTPVQNLRKWENRGEQYYKPDIGAAEKDLEKPGGVAIQPDNESTETGIAQE